MRGGMTGCLGSEPRGYSLSTRGPQEIGPGPLLFLAFIFELSIILFFLLPSCIPACQKGTDSSKMGWVRTSVREKRDDIRPT